MFKESYKYYKTKSRRPDLSEVLVFENDEKVPKTNALCKLKISDDYSNLLGLQPVAEWRSYTLSAHPGLILVRNPFTIQGQRYWIARCLQDYPRHPNKVNLHANLFAPVVLQDWWHALQLCEDKKERRRMKISMRWTTLGYHHDWDTKVYNEAMRNDFPEDLNQLCKCFALALGFHSFAAQASIVNYYPIGTTLAGHTDHSEMNLQAPLFSFSFGHTAIFLIGGETKEEKPTAIFLCSGDVLVMSGASRLCYHAVPRVMRADTELWNELIPAPNWNCHRLSLSTTMKQREEDASPAPQSGMDMKLYQRVKDEVFWTPFKNYLNDARINVNVRQVLNPGIVSLSVDG